MKWYVSVVEVKATASMMSLESYSYFISTANSSNPKFCILFKNLSEYLQNWQNPFHPNSIFLSLEMWVDQKNPTILYHIRLGVILKSNQSYFNLITDCVSYKKEKHYKAFSPEL